MIVYNGMISRLQVLHDNSWKAYLIRYFLAFGGFSGVVISLLELLQGDSFLSIILPLVLALCSILLLFVSRISKSQTLVIGLIVLIYNFIFFPVIWIIGHGIEGPAVLYLLLLLVVLSILIHRIEILIPVSVLFVAMAIFLILWNHDGSMVNRFYDYEYQRKFDYVFNVLFASSILIGIVRLLYGRIQMLQKEIERTKTLDNLTGLYNQKRIMEILRSELLRSNRQKQDISVVMLSLTNFSTAIRQRGHFASEHLLKTIAHSLRGKSRMYDILGYLHMSDFLCILPGSSYQDSEEYIRRICKDDQLIGSDFRELDVELVGQILRTDGCSFEELADQIDAFSREKL